MFRPPFYRRFSLTPILRLHAFILVRVHRGSAPLAPSFCLHYIPSMTSMLILTTLPFLALEEKRPVQESLRARCTLLSGCRSHHIRSVLIPLLYPFPSLTQFLHSVYCRDLFRLARPPQRLVVIRHPPPPVIRWLFNMAVGACTRSMTTGTCRRKSRRTCEATRVLLVRRGHYGPTTHERASPLFFTPFRLPLPMTTRVLPWLARRGLAVPIPLSFRLQLS